MYLLLLPNISNTISSVPMPETAVSRVDNGSELYSGSSLYLTCSIQLQQIEYVDTLITVLSSWDTPSSEHDLSNPNNSYIVDLEINNVHIADSGAYTCKASVHDTNDSIYVVKSQKRTKTVSITISK